MLSIHKRDRFSLHKSTYLKHELTMNVKRSLSMILSFFSVLSSLPFFFVCHRFLFSPLRTNHNGEKLCCKWNLLWMAFTFGILPSLRNERKLFTQRISCSAGVIGEMKFYDPHDLIFAFAWLGPGRFSVNVTVLWWCYRLNAGWRHELRHVAIKLNYSIF